MKAILVRIGIDHSCGAWNAPADPSSGDFVYVPIPDGETKRYTPGSRRRYDEVAPALSNFTTRHRNRLSAELRLPGKLLRRSMHLDPDFDHLTYGDNGTRRGAGIAKLCRNDLLVFYAGLRSIADPKGLLYALVGLFVVKEVVRAIGIPRERWRENAHTRWTVISDNDIVVRGNPRRSGRLDRCIPIGEWRDRAYRISPRITDAWGGVKVKDGYIQRSAVPPELLNPAKFYRWFLRHDVKLLRRNN